jgi:DNA primase
MALFTKDSVDRVKDAADIVEIVSAHTDLQQRGKDYWGNCPFHDERTPSFKVNPQDKLYYCFGCEASGDVFRFVEEKEGLAFPDAVESLAERYGVELKRESEDPAAEARRRRRGRLYEVLERTAAFYSSYLWDSEKAAKARQYLEERGLGEDVLRSFDVGMAPSAWDQVLTSAQRAGFKVEELRDAGLIQKGKQGGHYDRFRSRIMFPIRDQRGRVVGFGARALRPDSKPKYLNSPEGELYRKSETLYGIDRARGEIAKAGRAVVVEGYTDVLALHQAGIAETVAIMGTAITPEQLQALSGLTDTVVLALDADRSGADAMIRAQKVAGGRGIQLRVAAMPENEDPADMAKAGELDRFRELVDAAIDLPSFRVQTALSRADLDSVAGRERALGEIAPVLAAMGEAVGRDEMVREAADRLDTDPSLISERVRIAERTGGGAGEGKAPSGNGSSEAPAAPAREVLTPREMKERWLLAACIADPAKGREFIDRLTEEHLSPAGGRALAWLRDHLEDPTSGLPRDDEELVSLITKLAMASERREPAEPGAMELNFKLLELRRLEDGISAAQKAGDYESGARLSEERAALTDRIAHAQASG